MIGCIFQPGDLIKPIDTARIDFYTEKDRCDVKEGSVLTILRVSDAFGTGELFLLRVLYEDIVLYVGHPLSNNLLRQKFKKVSK